MRNVKRWLSVAAFSVSLGLTGCVSSSQYKKVQAERNQLRRKSSSARPRPTTTRTSSAPVSEDSANKDEQITALSSEKSDLQAQLDEINQQYAEALEPRRQPPAAWLYAASWPSSRRRTPSPRLRPATGW